MVDFAFEGDEFDEAVNEVVEKWFSFLVWH